jgi:hypothetical protein
MGTDQIMIEDKHYLVYTELLNNEKKSILN